MNTGFAPTIATAKTEVMITACIFALIVLIMLPDFASNNGNNFACLGVFLTQREE